MTQDEKWMGIALDEALKAYAEGEVPVGAVIVSDGRILGRGYNRTEALQDPTAHAEMIAITAAAEARKSWRLGGCTLYVTLEPCAMCAGAIVLARIPRLVYGCDDPKAGACGTLRNIVEDYRLNHRAEVIRGIRGEEAASLLRRFFRERRGQAGSLDETERCESG